MFFKKKRALVPSRPEQAASKYPLLKRVPLGKNKYDILGEEYRQDVLRKIYETHKKQDIQFSITLPVPYQHEHDWPPMPFLNVNLANSRITTAQNWLGYLRTNFFSEIDLVTFFEQHAPISVSGRIVIRDHKYQIVLLLPLENEPFTFSITYDSTATPMLLELATSLTECYIPVNMEKVHTPKGEVYQLTYQNKVIGPTSMKKTKEIDEWLAGRSIASARFGLYTFQNGEIRPYSKVAITPSLPIR